MSYKTDEVLAKLNISKFKLDKLVDNGYIDVWKEHVKSGSYHYEVKHYSKAHVDKLTDKKIEKALKKIKLDESRDLESKYVNKSYKTNNKMIKECSHYNRVNNIRELTKEINLKINSSKYPRDINYYARKKKLDENSWYKVMAIGTYTFDFWKDALGTVSRFDEYGKPLSGEYILDLEDIYSISPSWDAYKSNCNFILASVVVEVIDIQSKKLDCNTRIAVIKEFKDLEYVKIICEECEETVVYASAISEYNGKTICSNCKSKHENLDRSRKIKKSIIESGKCLIIDIETTGLSYGYDEIIDLAVLNTDGDVLINTRVKPGVRISNGAFEAHRISENDLIDAPGLKELEPILTDILEDKVLVFYGDFHRYMFQHNLSKYNININYKCRILEAIQSLAENVEYEENRLRLRNVRRNALSDCREMLKLIKEY